MTKTEAIRIFGSTVTALANAVGVSRSAVSQWPERLRQDHIDRVIGAGVRLGRITLTVDGEVMVVERKPDEIPVSTAERRAAA